MQRKKLTAGTIGYMRGYGYWVEEMIITVLVIQHDIEGVIFQQGLTDYQEVWLITRRRITQNLDINIRAHKKQNATNSSKQQRTIFLGVSTSQIQDHKTFLSFHSPSTCND
jgi:hypothetical protein